jgi:hypothetical protein
MLAMTIDRDIYDCIAKEALLPLNSEVVKLSFITRLLLFCSKIG